MLRRFRVERRISKINSNERTILKSFEVVATTAFEARKYHPCGRLDGISIKLYYKEETPVWATMSPDNKMTPLEEHFLKRWVQPEEVEGLDVYLLGAAPSCYKDGAVIGHGNVPNSSFST